MRNNLDKQMPSNRRPCSKRNLPSVVAILGVLGLGVALFFLINKSPKSAKGAWKLKGTSFLPPEQVFKASHFSEARLSRQPPNDPLHSEGVPLPSGKGTAPRVPAHAQIITYGNGEGQLGIQRLPEVEDRGPESFFVDAEGSLHIADKVNERVLSYTLEGEVKSTVPLENCIINDLIIGTTGGFITYDASRGQLQSFDKSGVRLSTITVALTGLSRGYFHRVNNQIFFAASALNDVLVATEENGILRQVDSQTSYRGIFGSSGRRFEVGLAQDRAFFLRIWSQDQSETPFSTVEVDLPGVLSTRFVGETEDGAACVQIERMEKNNVVIEAFLFDEDGEQTQRVQLPPVPYQIWTTRLIDIAPGGEVVQFAPGTENALLRVFSTISKGE